MFSSEKGLKKGCRSPVSRILSLPRSGNVRSFILPHQVRYLPCGMVRLIPGDSERAGNPSPVLSCATRGFHCLLGYPWSGGLLPHLFTLTPGRVGPGAVCFLLHYPSERLEPVVPCSSQGALPYGVRTFLYTSCDTQRSSGERPT